MSFRIDLDEDRAVILVRHNGVMTVDEVDECRGLIGRLAGERGWTRILIDCLAVRRGPGMTGAYELGATNTERGLSWSMRIACLPPPQEWEAARLYETASRNRAVNVRLFASEKEALAWLMDGTVEPPLPVA
jgi:hypothetical protein